MNCFDKLAYCCLFTLYHCASNVSSYYNLTSERCCIIKSIACYCYLLVPSMFFLLTGQLLRLIVQLVWTIGWVQALPIITNDGSESQNIHFKDNKTGDSSSGTRWSYTGSDFHDLKQFKIGIIRIEM